MYIKEREKFTTEHATYNFKGYILYLMKNIYEQWIMPAPFSNPAMLEMFNDQHYLPQRSLERWSGEFAGKYLLNCIELYSLTGDEKLKKHTDWFVEKLIDMQKENGYLGPWSFRYQLTGFDQNNIETWDTWGHYLLMLCTAMWYEETGHQESLVCACKIGDLLCDKFLNKKIRMVDIGVAKVNLAPIHSLCILYKITGIQKYLDLAKEIEKDLEVPPAGIYPAGDYIRCALAGMEFYQMPEPRWEGLHTVQGIAQLYYITGDKKYKQAFEHIWWSIVKTDRHNTGGFSTDERAVGSQFKEGAIETCCTIEWMALSCDMLKLTGNSIVADELELSFFNAGLGALSPSGRWCTYDTPRDGVKKASAHSIVFQAREGSPELNCCSVNGPRAISLLRDWAVMSEGNNIILNFYGLCTVNYKLKTGNQIRIEQETQYPITGKVKIGIYPKQEEEFTIKLRIPYWSEKTKVKINGHDIAGVNKGEYLTLIRKWEYGDTITLEMDMTLHFWSGEDGYEGKSAVYRGPILLTYDRKINDYNINDIPLLDPTIMSKNEKLCTEQMWNEKYNNYDNLLKPWMLFEYEGIDGRPVCLCDFATAGDGGSRYVSWLKINDMVKADFTKKNPLRSVKCV